MKLLGSEKGIALVMVLVLSAVMVAIMAGLVYMLTVGTQVSGIQKRYRTASEAAEGCKDAALALIDAGGASPIPLPGFSITSGPCLSSKVVSGTSAANWASCGSLDRAVSLTIDPGDPLTYDFSFGIGTGPTYTCYAKIADTVMGNTSFDYGKWLRGGVVWSEGGGEAVARPYYYTIEVDTQNAANPTERAKYSIRYQH